MLQESIVFKQLEVKGFVIFNPVHRQQLPTALKEMAQWIKEASFDQLTTVVSVDLF